MTFRLGGQRGGGSIVAGRVAQYQVGTSIKSEPVSSRDQYQVGTSIKSGPVSSQRQTYREYGALVDHTGNMDGTTKKMSQVFDDG
ncbi:MAG: hypothetical protein ACI9G1_001327 [Pirellulaceae bacterium]|jgi:hypothetical protein